MKKLLLTVALAAIFFSPNIFAQSNWINRLSYDWQDPGMFYYKDTVCGVINAAQGADGNYYILAKTLLDNTESLFKVGPDGGAFLWKVENLGWHATLSKEEAGAMRITSDSGCILFVNHSGWSTDYYTY